MNWPAGTTVPAGPANEGVDGIDGGVVADICPAATDGSAVGVEIFDDGPDDGDVGSDDFVDEISEDSNDLLLFEGIFDSECDCWTPEFDLFGFCAEPYASRQFDSLGPVDGPPPERSPPLLLPPLTRLAFKRPRFCREFCVRNPPRLSPELLMRRLLSRFLSG
ncbi:hypothetical protein DERF_007680 [Dermatophagoides farinae]|uniref:Uncharacterized protein n=1 Tax=Dermatophagoides farinae TaxID=6954 RepID=A0A922HZG7_DERFA|nr:hypothetical protein DERF_007680 [Dermatophagoides farinae]